MTADEPSRVRPPDVEFGATVRAKRIVFDSKPDAEVRFGGDLEEATSTSDRENLPDEVEPGEYRDVGVRWLAAAWGADPTTIDGETEEER
jgi:hypothetical protein